jgi:hypothetical protein
MESYDNRDRTSASFQRDVQRIKMQILVTFGRAFVIEVPQSGDVCAVADRVLDAAGIPRNALSLLLTSNGRPVSASHSFVVGEMIVALPRGGILGGKGGFGANLRAAGKTGPKAKTHSFGYCRDLNGRRLKSVNDEIRLRKWLSEPEQKKREKLGDEYIEEKGAAGLSGWFLGVPTWAEGYKHKSTGELVAISSSQCCIRRAPSFCVQPFPRVCAVMPRSRKKTVICSFWKEARELRPGEYWRSLILQSMPSRNVT